MRATNCTRCGCNFKRPGGVREGNFTTIFAKMRVKFRLATGRCGDPMQKESSRTHRLRGEGP